MWHYSSAHNLELDKRPYNTISPGKRYFKYSKLWVWKNHIFCRTILPDTPQGNKYYYNIVSKHWISARAFMRDMTYAYKCLYNRNGNSQTCKRNGGRLNKIMPQKDNSSLVEYRLFMVHIQSMCAEVSKRVILCSYLEWRIGDDTGVHLLPLGMKVLY
jgi:hypothetical protein